MIVCLGTTPAVQRTMRFGRLVLDQVNRATSVHTSPAGKSVNVARVLRMLGEEVLAMGFAGGSTGEFIRTELERAGLRQCFVPVSAPTRICTTLIDEAANQTTELVEEGAAVDDGAAQALLDRLEEALNGAAALMLSGSLAKNVPVDFYARCMERAAARKVPVVVDAFGPALNAAIGHGPMMIKPNRHEVGITLGREISNESEVLEAMRKMLELGAQRVIVTCGASTVLAMEGARCWKVTPPKVQASNAIGSGDAFAAGWISSYLREGSMVEALKMACACGAANALTPLAGYLHVEDVERLRTQVRVDEI